jgi:hypothetical protein
MKMALTFHAPIADCVTVGHFLHRECVDAYVVIFQDWVGGLCRLKDGTTSVLL